jgi:hypothetical protein
MYQTVASIGFVWTNPQVREKSLKPFEEWSENYGRK